MTKLKQKMHFWVGNKSGYLWSYFINAKPKPKKGERLKYLGFTFDVGFPKTMNTGRIIYEATLKPKN